MKRREFITLLGSAVAAWPLAARAQQGERMRRIGTLSAFGADDPGMARPHCGIPTPTAAIGLDRGPQLADGLSLLGDLRARPNLRGGAGGARPRRSSGRWRHERSATPSGNPHRADRVRKCARSCGSGIVDSLARPGGNITGFMQFEYSLTAKWLELLKEVARGLKRVAVLRDATITPGIGQFAVIQSVAPSLGVEVSPIGVRDVPEIERAVTAFARSGNGGLIVSGSALAVVHRDPIIALAAWHKLPAIYYTSVFVPAGGLMSYGPNITDQFRDAADYVDRILRGENPGDLPVQAPTEVRTRDQSQNCKGPRPHRATDPPRPRRRGDRITPLFVAAAHDRLWHFSDLAKCLT